MRTLFRKVAELAVHSCDSSLAGSRQYFGTLRGIMSSCLHVCTKVRFYKLFYTFQGCTRGCTGAAQVARPATVTPSLQKIKAASRPGARCAPFTKKGGKAARSQFRSMLKHLSPSPGMIKQVFCAKQFAKPIPGPKAHWIFCPKCLRPAAFAAPGANSTNIETPISIPGDDQASVLRKTLAKAHVEPRGRRIFALEMLAPDSVF